MNLNVFYGILIPFIGTSAGAACVFFMKKDLNQWVQRCLTGFAAGVMVAASVWSLLIPALEQSEGMGKLSFVPAAVGFWAGVLFLLLLDHIIPHLHQQTDKAEGPKSRLQKTTMLILAVTLHNIPEGMAVGVVYAGYLTGNVQITLIYFGAPDRKEFHTIVKTLAQRNGITMPEDELLLEAGKWEISHGGLTGRTAQQFIDHLLGKEETQEA